MKNDPIGVLDSGIGGLTVLRAIIEELPLESYIYIGDSYNTPYGAKTEEEIYFLAKQLVEFLLTKKVKLIVVACNTITVSCLDRLRSDYPEIPMIGTVPVIKTAAAVTGNKRIGILSTTRTAQSEYQKKLIHTFAQDCKVFNYGTDILVPLIEQGRMETPEMIEALKKVLAPFQKEHIDTLALGCTHFPLLKTHLEKLLGANVRLLDSGSAIARHVKRVLQYNTILAENTDDRITIYTTGNMNIAKKIFPRTIREQTIQFEEVRLT